MKETNPFKPFPFLEGRHYQTILGTIFNIKRAPKSTTHYVLLPDQDVLALEISTPPNWKESDPTVVMIHGLCGSHNSPYLVRLSRKLFERGVRSVRVNLRGCGSGRGLARYMYHSSSSKDIALVLKKLKKLAPHSPHSLLGFSMGGNIALKTIAELSLEGNPLVERVIAVSPPVNLQTSSRLLSYPENRIYELYFIRLLRNDAAYRQRLFPDLPQVKLKPDMHMFEFDEVFTAPHLGHSSAFEYYAESSSLPLISEISVPCKILYSVDDPIIDGEALDQIALPSHITVYKTANGGHMGFLGTPGQGGKFRWMDHVLLTWLEGEGKSV